MANPPLFKIHKELTYNDQYCELVIETFHSDHKAYTAIHKKIFVNSLGGVRFVTSGSLQEVMHLAQGMSEKCAVNSVPVNGLKCLIICNGKIPDDAAVKAEMIAYHLKIVKELEPGVIFGPDMGSPEEVMDMVASKFGLLSNVTGLSKKEGGLQIDKNGYTAIGAYESIVAAELPQKEVTLSLQGFGAVGTFLLSLMNSSDYGVRAISNIKGVLIGENNINKGRLLQLYFQKGDDCLSAYAEENKTVRFSSDRSDLFKVPVDLFVPAARTTIIADVSEIEEARKENPEVISVQEFYESVKPKLVLEIANHPLTYLAEGYLEKKDVLVLPDFVVNCGGMIGCYNEWKNRNDLRASSDKYDSLNAECKRILTTEINKNIKKLVTASGSKREMANALMEHNLKETIRSVRK